MKKSCLRFGPVVLLALVLGAVAGCTKQARVQRLLKTANNDFNTERYDNAEIEYKKVLRLEFNPVAIGQLGRIYAKEGRLWDAHSCLAKATELQPNSLPFQLALGQVDGLSHDPADAAKIALRILTAQPTNEDALLLWVESFTPAQDLRQRVDALPRIKENPVYHVALGIIALRQQKFADAATELNMAVAANPKSSPAYFALAEYYALQNKRKEMAQALETAADLAPLRSTMRMKESDFLIQSGAVEEARKRLQQISEKAPDYIPAWVSLMNLAMAEKNYGDAARCADTILSRDNRNYDALLMQGKISAAQGDAKKAVAQFTHVDSIYNRSPEVKYELAGASLMAHDKVRTLAYLNQALALNTNFLKATLLLGELYLGDNKSGAAVELLTGYTKRVPGAVQPYLLLADAYQAQHQMENALSVYRKLSDAMPKNPEFPLKIGVLLAQQRNNSEARAAFEKSLELAPDYVPAFQHLIGLDIAERKYNEATALAQTQVNQHPKAAEPWEVLAKIDLAQTNFAHAETALLKAMELDPNLPGPYLMLSEIYIQADKYKEALGKLNALVGKTNDVAAYLQIGAIHDRLKEYDAAKDAYEKVLTLNSNSVAALNNLAFLYAMRLKQIDKAYEMAQKARELLPYDPSVGDTLGWVLFQKGDYTRALAVLQESAQKAPSQAEFQFHLGMTHYMLDDEELARIELQRAVASPQDYPNKDDARNHLAILNMIASASGPSALAGLEKALQDHPGDPVILNHIGALQEQEGAWDRAASTYETILKQKPDTSPIMAKLARIYTWRLNQPEKALNLAKAAHKLEPENAEVSATLGHLIYRAGDYAWALSLLQSAADRLPNQPELIYDLAWAYYSLGRIADAEKAMLRVQQSGAGFAGSEDAKRFVSLTDAFGSASKAQAAAGQARTVLQTDAKYVPALMVSAVADERAGNFKAAQQEYIQALEVFPMFAPADRQLAILDANHFPDDPQGCLQAEKARTAYPNDPEVARSLGILSYYQAKYPRSAELLAESIAKNKDEGDLYYYLGMDYFQLKRSQESKQALGRAIALKIPDKQATEAKRILAGLK